MKAPDRPYPLTDIGDAPDSLDLPEPFALFRISGNKDNFIDYLMERINQAFNECPAKVRKKILLLPVCTPGFTTNQYDCRSQCATPFIPSLPLQIYSGQEYFMNMPCLIGADSLLHPA